MKQKTAIITIVIALVLAVTTALYIVRATEDRVTADFVARVDRFAIPADWKQESEIVRPERFLCMSPNPCPSISKRWDAGKETSLDELKSVISGVGFEMKIERNCQRRGDAIGNTTVCEATGNDGAYDYILNVASPDPNEPNTIVLSVQPHL
ncbi:hypothetical protein [Pseudarthrobacter sp. IC2-21]|uniref:hypothetical protein n=1 Tax=Pseudarthrobacter sp. IC2-21 TaxID=3092262 RepID=UPI002A6B2FD1|nr:hypothetical protein [Pseudarthrobacter sp. IC2-21]